VHTDPDQGADEQLGREQEVMMLREAIRKLKEQERTVLALYYFEALKLHEIAGDSRPHRVARVADSVEGAREAARDGRNSPRVMTQKTQTLGMMSAGPGSTASDPR
jgi:hypothetical protein